MLIIDLKNSATWKKLPPFIKTAEVFQHIKRIVKPFPEIGLPNILEPLNTNFPDKPTKAYIGFTSQAMQGVWDLATMSMRGVCSCMHWYNGHSSHLVGSVADPFLGIVYITDNQHTPYGITFKWRSLVRLLYNSHDKSYRLLIERVYKDTGNQNRSLYLNKDPNEFLIMDLFKTFLATHVNPNFKVIIPTECMRDHYGYIVDAIPHSDHLNYTPHIQRSMSDCNMYYNRVEDAFATKFASQI